MASSFTHTQTRSAISTGYRVVDTVTASVNIPLEPFVFATETGLYNRIATAVDMQTLPNSQAAAVTDEADYYRLPTVTYDAVLLAEADDFAEVVKERLQLLVIEYAAAVADFIGEEQAEVVTS